MCGLTGVNEELIGNSRVVYIVDRCSEKSSEDLQVGEDSLRGTKRAEEEDKVREVFPPFPLTFICRESVYLYDIKNMDKDMVLKI